jgi:cyclophilin family peptidyl-prolyl cis-trans isomerase/HEAT repeat protein
MSERLASKRALLVCGVVVTCTAAGAIAASNAHEARGSFVSQPASDTALRQRVLDAEDSRATDSASLVVLYQGLESTDTAVRRVAARALGRIERSAGLGALRSVFDDPSPEVRVEAVNAIAQIVNGEVQRARAAGDSSAGDREVIGAVGGLIGLSAAETDQRVRDAIVRSVARLPYGSASAAVSAVSGLLGRRQQDTSTRADGGSGRSISNFGRAYALDALVRRNPALRTEPAIVNAVADLGDVRVASAAERRANAWTREARVLRAAVRGRMLTAASLAGSADPNAIHAMRAIRAIHEAFVADFRDADPQVRRQVISLVASATALDDTARTWLVDAALRDPSFHVRVEAVRAYARRANASCAPLVTATRDANPHVALTAIDVMPAMAACRELTAALDRLLQLVRTIPAREVPRAAGRGTWHSGAHALVTLARIAPDSARQVISERLAHPVWQVRMYTASAAGVLADTATLGRLANDSVDNVRDAAVNALSALIRPAAGSAPPRIARTAQIDSIFVAQLARKDYQLVLDAARALEGAPANAHTVEALFAALERITAERGETSRDPRTEVLARVQSIASADHASRLTSYLTDFDPAVAERAAAMLRGWGVAAAAAAPRPLAPIGVSVHEAATLKSARVRVTMAPRSGGGSFELRLFAEDAPATVSRFVSLARRGYYDNLTFHRVATNFVIQGGSPGANEYVGHDRFMRDELGLRSHTRGTLGISTRGRDTGDAQIFVNLIDNFRLDHDYTVFAEVVRGMSVVDGILEGDVIARVELLGPR